MKADEPLLFINCVDSEFLKGKKYRDENFIIPSSLFEFQNFSCLLKHSAVNSMKLSQNNF